MGKPVRVLYVIAGMGSGGAEAFLMNMYRHTDRTKVQYDFLLRSEENFYRDELEALGSRVYYTASFPRHFIKNYFQVRKILKENRYDIVHVHANAMFYMTALLEAKHQGVRCRIMHSHNTASYYPRFQFVHDYFKKRIKKISTHRFACSDEAGKWMFGDDFEIIHNAIDLNTFQFSADARKEIREGFGIAEESLVVGHVGRFFGAKNHKFLVDVFAHIIRQRPDAVLVLIGEGELEPEIRKKIDSYGIGSNVIFAGTRKDVGRVMSAFDVFVFPSLFEGLGIVVIEAQANGMPVISSLAVPPEAEVSPCLKRVQLDLGAEAWADIILLQDFGRTETRTLIQQAGYDVNFEAKRLERFYLNESQYREIDE